MKLWPGWRIARFIACACLALATCGCSVKRMAINKIGDSLVSGSSTFDTDDDPVLVGQALPFALKLIETLQLQAPKNQNLLLAATQDFTEYSYAFVEEPADELADTDRARSQAMQERARRLYLRARDYGRRDLDLRYPGVWEALEKQGGGALARVKRKQDVPLLYWTAAAEGKAITESKGDPAMIAQLPTVEGLLTRAMALDADWSAGALDEFAISLEASRTDETRDAALANMRRYYDRALALSGGNDASLFVTYAESASVLAQDRSQFNQLLERALAVNPDAHPGNRLENLIAQRRARWLQAHGDDLIASNRAQATVMGGGR